MDPKKMGIPHVKVTVDENRIQDGALEILKVIRPYWDESRIEYKLLTDGITNKLVGCRLKELEDEETVLVRVYGNKTDLLIDRKTETRTIILLNKAGLAPNLYATFDNGLAYRFIPGCTLDCDSVRDPDKYSLVARMMARLHKIPSGNSQTPEPCIWGKIRKFLDLVPDVFTDPDMHRRYQDSGFPKSRIEKEIDEIKQVLVNLGNPVVFAHNDLLLGNVIYTEKTHSVTLIDYEYAAFNYQAYDIANHFAEFVGLDSIDYTKYPGKELQSDWLKAYYEEFHGRSPTENDIDILYVQVNKFALLSHLFWGIWALIQAEHSYIEFDYLGYAVTRFQEYLRKKHPFLSLNMPS